MSNVRYTTLPDSTEGGGGAVGADRRRVEETSRRSRVMERKGGEKENMMEK